MDVTIYDDRGWHHKTTSVDQPTWFQIEKATRRLDQYCYPSITLLLNPEDRGDPGKVRGLTITGGNGTYSMECAAGHLEFHQYYDPLKGEKEVAVWTSDQGYYPEERYVCYDVELVLKVSRYYAEHGEMDPAVKWT